MTGIGKRIASALVTGVLALAGITACGAQQGPAAPTNAQELLARYEAAENHDNYHLDMDMAIKLDILGSSLEMPITASYDVAGTDSHGTMSMDLSSLLGEPITTETYATKEDAGYVQYVNAGDETWIKTTAETGDLASNLTSADLFKDAKFNALGTSDAEAYELIISGQQLLDALGQLGETATALDGTDDAAANDMLANSEVHYVFSKDCLPSSLSLELSYEATDGEEDGLSAGMGLTVKATFSAFGTIDAASVKVPDDVASKATDTQEIADGVEELVNLFGGGEDAAAEDATSQTSETSQSAA